jgi:hypothetical protein
MDALPQVIGIKTTKLAPLLRKWRRHNRCVPWSALLDDALRGRSPLVKLAGKRHAHLVNGKAAA